MMKQRTIKEEYNEGFSDPRRVHQDASVRGHRLSIARAIVGLIAS